MFEECSKKQSVKIKRRFASHVTVLDKYMRTGFDKIFCSTPIARQRKFSLPVSSSVCWKWSCPLLWVKWSKTFSQWAWMWDHARCAGILSGFLNSLNVQQNLTSKYWTGYKESKKKIFKRLGRHRTHSNYNRDQLIFFFLKDFDLIFKKP